MWLRRGGMGQKVLFKGQLKPNLLFSGLAKILEHE